MIHLIAAVVLAALFFEGMRFIANAASEPYDWLELWGVFICGVGLIAAIVRIGWIAFE